MASAPFPLLPRGKLLDRVLATAREAAYAAGAIQTVHFGNPGSRVIQASAHDLKIDVDRRCETAICAVIRARFPEHAILSEECGAMGPAAADHVWVIDPLDGTVNYFHGMPYFCACVACYRLKRPWADLCETPSGYWLPESEPLAGAVYAPLLDRMYSAAKGRGATCNDAPLNTPSVSRLGEAVVGISYGSRESTMVAMERLIADLVRQVRKVRILGATGLDIAQVAGGSIHGLVQPRVRAWDFAASRIILEESGGYFSAQALPGGGWQVLAAARRLHRDLEKLTAKALTAQLPAN